LDSNRSASSLAEQLSHELSVENTEELEAQRQDRAASEYRANATFLVRETTQMALNAGAAAAQKQADAIMQQMSDLESRAAQAEISAAKFRAQSLAEVQKARNYMAIADAAITIS